MAVTKIKPIRGTVNKALAYILDPAKTDDQLYVSSFGCAASDAAAKEFEWTRNLAAQQGMQMPKVIARHLIQSFDIGEVTPEQAHEIGKQFADEWLKGKYEYVIATHIDKGHCHNHIIFNAVNFVDYIPFSDARSWQNMTSTPICCAMLKGSLVSQRLTRSLPIFERFLALIIPPPFVGHYTIRDIRYNGLISLPRRCDTFSAYIFYSFPLPSNRHRSELSLLRQVRLRSEYHRQTYRSLR